MTSNHPTPHLGVVERSTGPKRRRRSGKSAFSSAELHRRFEQHVSRAQHLFLQNDKDGAEREATLALRIHPTDHLFALLAVIADSKGQRERASDFRLLQAFLANDPVLWEELLHEFLQEQMYYKSAVCLQRLSALETKDKNRYRTLQLQLADLYIGLGEVGRAANILVPLWNGSRCRDFEVFALLSSLFFQLGRWNSLHRLIESSVKSTFRRTVAVEGVEGRMSEFHNADTNVSGIPVASGDAVASSGKRRTSKRVRFFGGDGDDDDADGTAEMERQVMGEKGHESEVPACDAAVASFSSQQEEDDFDFSNLGGSNEGGGGSTMSVTPSVLVQSLYGDSIDLRTPTAKKNFLTLVNVHAELLNEEGKFIDTVRLIEFTAGCLQVALLDLPPDLLLRLGLAYGYLGGWEQQCRELFTHLLDTCPMAEYGDVLYDGAIALQQVGMHKEALMIFQTVRRYYEFQLTLRNSEESGVDTEELAEVKTVFVASLFAEGQCEASLGDSEVAYEKFRRVLEVDPSHTQARLALGRMYMYEMSDTDRAVAVLTPREDEQLLERIQLGAELVRVFARAEKYVEAIALGVSLFELILSGEDDGDTESIAPGSSRRSTAPLSMPTLSRASSAIIPPSALSGIMSGTGMGTLASSSVGRLSHSLATSIKSASVVFRSNLARRGNVPLTNSVYGASAAASTAAGWSRGDAEDREKDSSTIFCFHRRKKPTKRLRDMQAKEDNMCNNRDSTNNANDMKKDSEENDVLLKERQRLEEVTSRAAKYFWSEEERVDDGEKRVKAELENLQSNVEDQMKKDALDEQDFAQVEETLVEEEVDGDTVSQYELPSLEEVSKQFGDPSMQELFIQASRNDISDTIRNPWETGEGVRGAGAPLAAVGGDALVVTPSVPEFRVTMRDALGVLGRAGFIELAVTVIDCYSAIGKFTEAKEFAFVVLTRCPRTSIFRHASVLERPLRWAVLRAALASGEGEDAYRVGVRLLQEQCSEEEKNQVVQLLFSVLNRVEDSGAILLRLVTDRGKADPPLLVLLGNRYFLRRSYIRALNLYLVALQMRPNDAFICFLIGISYLLISHQKKIQARESCVVAACHYLSQYQETVRVIDAKRHGEAVYNSARAFQYIGLHHLALPLYEQVAYEYRVPEECTLALQRAARWNLYFTYRWRTGNRALALAALQPRK